MRGLFLSQQMTERRTDSLYLEALSRRVLVYDGAMGTNIQRYDLSADDFGGKSLEGCNDHLVLTRPDVISAIHESFLEVGCDVVETCTFQSTPRRLHEWGLGDKVREINVAAAKLARAAADKYSTPDKPRFVAASMGPTGMLPSSSDPVLSQITYDELGNNLAGTFMDYLVPTAVEVPAWEVGKTVTPSPHHPIGAKGVGESATVGAPPAIANAVVDALWHLGVRHIDIPITPQKVWAILHEKGIS